MKKFSIDQKILSNATSFCVKGVSSNPTIPAHENLVIKIKDGILYMKGLNHKFGLYDTIQINSGDDLDMAVPGFDFHRIISALSGTLDFLFSPMKNTVEIKSGKSKYKLFAEEPINYPIQSTADAKPILSIHSDVLNKAIQATSASIKPDALRPQIECMHIHKNGSNLSAAGVNMFSVSVNNSIEASCYTDDIDLSVMPYVFGPIQGLSGAIEVKQNSLFTEYKSDNKRRIVQLKSHGSFPAYKPVIDRNYTHVFNVDRNEFIKALSRVSLMSNPLSNAIEFSFSDGILRMRGKDFDFNKEGVEEIVVEGNDKLVITLNSKMLLDLVNSRKIPKLELLLIDAKNPLRINGADNVSSILMAIA